MRSILTIFLILAVLPVAGYSAERPFRVKVFDTARGRQIGLADLTVPMRDADVVFIGEQHDDSVTHLLEEVLVKNLLAADPQRDLSLEMFERDVQPLLDQWLTGRITEAEFLAGSRPWTNYRRDYRLTVQTARDAGRHILAANVPRVLAGRVARSGEVALQNFSEVEKSWSVDRLHAPRDRYWRLFRESMKEMAKSGKHGSMKEMIWQIYQAQCLKDDTMARAMAQHISDNPERRIIHLNGRFHSDYHLGTVSRLKKQHPQKKMLVISIAPREAGDSWRLTSEDAGRGDFVIYCPRRKSLSGKEKPAEKSN